MEDVLIQLKNRPTIEEQFPEYKSGLQKGKRRVLQLENIRNDKFTMHDILSADKEILTWWENIDAG